MIDLTDSPEKNADTRAPVEKRRKLNEDEKENSEKENAVDRHGKGASQDVKVVADNSKNAFRELPHKRCSCAVHTFELGKHEANSKFCAKCFCAACDKRASDCKQWGDGLSWDNHCNATGRLNNAQRQWNSQQAAAEATAQHKAHEDSLMDDDMLGLSDSELRRVTSARAQLHNTTTNPWVYRNEDAEYYSMSSLTETRPKPTKRPPITVDAAVLASCTTLGTIEIPLEVTDETYYAMQHSVADAPFGYHGDAIKMQDWRSWEGYYQKRWSLASIMLHNKIPDTIREDIKYEFDIIRKVQPSFKTMPELPKRVMKLLPAKIAHQYGTPPVDTRLRACLLVDCTSDQQPRFIGVHTDDTSTIVDVRRTAASALGMSFNETEQDLAGGTCLIVGTMDATSVHPGFVLRNDRPLHQLLKLNSWKGNFMTTEQQNSSWLVCWRVACIPKNLTESSGSKVPLKIPVGEYSPGESNHHFYACVRTGIAQKKTDGGVDQPWIGFLPVPVMVPLWSSTDGPAVTSLKDDASGTLVKKVLAVHERWGVLSKEQEASSGLKKQLAPRMYALQTGSRYFFEQGNIKVEGSEIFAVSTDPSARAILNDFSSIFDRLHDDSVVPYAALLKEASPSTTDPAPVATKAVGAGPSQDVAGPSSSHSQPQSTAAATGAPSPALRDKLDETACQDSEMCNVDSTADDAAENGPKSSAVAVADAGGQQSDVGGWCAQHVMCLMMVWNSFDVPRGTVDELVGGALQLGRLVKPPCDGVTVTEEELVLHRGYEVAREEIQKHEKRLEMLPTAVLKGVIKQSSTGYTGELSGITIKPAMYAQSELVKVNGTPTLAINLLLRKRNPTYDGPCPIVQALDRFSTARKRGRNPYSARYDDEKVGCNQMNPHHPLQYALEFLVGTTDAWKAAKTPKVKVPRRLSLKTVLSAVEADASLPDMEQPAGLNGIKLHLYQRQTLRWMMDMEASHLRSKLWVPVNDAADPQDKLWFCPMLNKLSRNVPQGPRGGILAEEMGLGKTVEVLSLVLAAPAPPDRKSGVKVKSKDGTLIRSRGTLVVCKVSLVGQWVQEARSKLANKKARIIEYHGSNRIRNVRELASYDIVVTTYETLTSDMLGRTKNVKGCGDPNPVANIKWWRLVLDESHAVKDSKSKASKAILAIPATRRWACTGTPFNTSVTDLSAQLAALHMEPLGCPGFSTSILATGLVESKRELCFLLRTLMIRHSKQAVQEAGAWHLPDKHEELIPITLSPREWETYQDTHTSVAAAFAVYDRAGPAVCAKHTLSIMALLHPLRKLSSGGRFHKASLEVTPPAPAEIHGRGRHMHGGYGGALPAAGAGGAGPSGAVAAQERDPNEPCFPAVDDCECAVCFEEYEQPMMTPCKHWFCEECIKDALGANGMCPMCRSRVTVASLRKAVYPPKTEETPPKICPKKEAECSDHCSSRLPDNMVEMDSKVKVLVQQLKDMHAADASNKALIFTQFNESLKYTVDKLEARGFKCRTISGKMPMKQRAAAIQAFQSDPPTTVFVLSVRAAAVGITLTSANYVFFLEPLLNTALDDQAVGRAWRMGQKREVTVKRLFIKGSVEEAIMSVAKNRQVGVLTSDRANVRIDDMRELFAAPKPGADT